MSMFIDKSLIGTFSRVTHPYAKANNPDCPDYKPWLALSWIMYMDANNLYGYVMMQGWMLKKQKIGLSLYLINKMNRNKDLEYPEELHDTHNNYPCAPEKIGIDERYLIEHQKELGKKCGAKYKREKLCLTLTNKVKYILQYRNLKQYLSLGLKLTKVHRVLKFQSPWLRKYIDLNT